ncbi:cell adhesion molecule Dscam2-like [Brevipalpus obovatus]|uniref:cell adhesion molecule Dscam2-like n=1 Tax=Brevipalpus obovatus TaxID=246614 RepID=UPI003D9EE515
MMFLAIIILVSEFCLVISNEQPKISPIPTRTLSKTGKQATFSCHLEQGNLPVDFKWLKGNDEIRSSENIVIDTSKRISGLMIKSLATADTGNYSCLVSNSFGSDVSTFQLIVEGPPQWLAKPQDIRVGPRERFNIQCSGIGYPPANVLWKKLVDSDWRDLFEATKSFTKISPTEISGSQLMKDQDEGKYGCEITNGIEPNLWTEFQVKISGKFYLNFLL